MQFEHDGSKYFLEFQRSKKRIKVNRQGNSIEYTSKHPYTTARLLKETGDHVREVMTEHTVGCLPSDPFSNQGGRIHALRGLVNLVPVKELRAAIWVAYNTRVKESAEEKIKALEAQITQLRKTLQ